MPTVLLDTDPVSFLLKGDTRAAAYMPLLTGNRFALSFMTVAELFQWTGVRKWGARRAAVLEQTLTGYLILPADVEMCRILGTVPGVPFGRIAHPQVVPFPCRMRGSPPPPCATVCR